MRHRVSQYIEKHQLLSPGDTVLVGVSGGADSVALLLVLHDLGYLVKALQANFQLRGEESDRDEEFFFFDGKTVLIEKNLLSENQTGRRNFTIMHEGCHHVLRMLYPRDYAAGVNARRILRYRSTGEGWSREEWQVDRLTSSILMPRELVKQAMIRVVQRGRIKWLCPDSEAYGRFCGMSELLGVSKQALCIRMMGMGLIEEAELYPPYGVDVLAGDDFDG